MPRSEGGIGLCCVVDEDTNPVVEGREGGNAFFNDDEPAVNRTLGVSRSRQPDEVVSASEVSGPRRSAGLVDSGNAIWRGIRFKLLTVK